MNQTNDAPSAEIKNAKADVVTTITNWDFWYTIRKISDAMGPKARKAEPHDNNAFVILANKVFFIANLAVLQEITRTCSFHSEDF